MTKEYINYRTDWLADFFSYTPVLKPCRNSEKIHW